MYTFVANVGSNIQYFKKHKDCTTLLPGNVVDLCSDKTICLSAGESPFGVVEHNERGEFARIIHGGNFTFLTDQIQYGYNYYAGATLYCSSDGKFTPSSIASNICIGFVLESSNKTHICIKWEQQKIDELKIKDEWELINKQIYKGLEIPYSYNAFQPSFDAFQPSYVVSRANPFFKIKQLTKEDIEKSKVIVDNADKIIGCSNKKKCKYCHDK